MSNVATKTNKFAFLNDIEGITFHCVYDTMAVIEVQGEEALNIYYEASCFELIVSDTCEYLKINGQKNWDFQNETDLVWQINKLLGEIKTYNLSKIHAESTIQAVSEFSAIHKAIGTEGDSETAAVTDLSKRKPVVRIKLDSSNIYKGYAEWKGQRLWCSRFPSKFRIEGACYVVDDLVEQNGFWQVKGEIKPLVE